MEIIKTAIPLGVETPFQILHLSDTHLTRANLRDGERKVKLAENRLSIFPEAEAVLQSACAAACAAFREAVAEIARNPK